MKRGKPALPDSPDSIPGCFGSFGSPLTPNGPCRQCLLERACEHTTKFFVPKEEVRQDFKHIRDILRGAV